MKICVCAVYFKGHIVRILTVLLTGKRLKKKTQPQQQLKNMICHTNNINTLQTPCQSGTWHWAQAKPQ